MGQLEELCRRGYLPETSPMTAMAMPIPTQAPAMSRSILTFRRLNAGRSGGVCVAGAVAGIRCKNNDYWHPCGFNEGVFVGDRVP